MQRGELIILIFDRCNAALNLSKNNLLIIAPDEGVPLEIL